MKIETMEVSGIATALKWMRLPMKSEGDSCVETWEKWDTVDSKEPRHELELQQVGAKDDKLAKSLGQCRSGSGHDSFLKGIVVHAEFTATHDFILQLYRYHFRDTVSSESKMHMITKGGSIGDNCSKWVSQYTVDLVDNLIEEFNRPKANFLDKAIMCMLLGEEEKDIPQTKSELFECIIHNTPLGYMLTFGEVTNYLQLKSMYKQRKSHKMSGWSKVFVEWVKSLPMSYLITGEEK
jgi:hypothetical protein